MVGEAGHPDRDTLIEAIANLDGLYQQLHARLNQRGAVVATVASARLLRSVIGQRPDILHAGQVISGLLLDALASMPSENSSDAQT
ncbi:hypothetical protein HDA32_003122 [Spinactinospora alkalitolerans]|uniref:Uncharacterized protein n=1 Tax=Spinactinospora alkalitolerans TaxID=687207 RepID=A0A852TYD9_9ACTN|nr:hypothetical protein [Spinactinospora alkalitolerans]NYE48002.1 hypothetical protein [Spinactinospora alkalitolerans]